MCIMDVAIHSLTCTIGLCDGVNNTHHCCFFASLVAMHTSSLPTPQPRAPHLKSCARMAATARSELYSFWSKDLSGGAGLGDSS
jgi:hypothetical protein